MNALRSIKEKFSAGQGDYPPPGKSGQMQCGCGSGDEEAKADYINTLKNDLANTYYWSGNYVKDLFFFFFNWHPFLGMFLCHPNHPWGKRERIQMFLISLFLTMPMSVYIGKQAQVNQLSPGVVTTWTIIAVTLPDTIIGVVLYQLSIADTRCPACAGCLDILNKFCMNCFCLVGLISTGICFLMLNGSELDYIKAFRPLAMGKAYSYATWFPIWFILPCMGFAHVWWMESKALQKEQGSDTELLSGSP